MTLFRSTALGLTLSIVLLLQAGAASAQTCSAGSAKVVDVYKSFAPVDEAKTAGTPAPAAQRTHDVELGDTVAADVKDGANLASEACRRKVALFLNGLPIKGLKAYPPANAASGTWKFVLKITDDSREAWSALLGSPDFKRKVTASIGFEDQSALDSDDTPILTFTVIPTGWLALWCAIFVIMLGIFFWSTFSSNVIRNGDPSPQAPAGAKGVYSLAKLQGAWWFFVVLASYLLIGLVTGDFSNSINSTALILLGIGAGTVLGSAAIDASKASEEQKEAQRQAADEAKQTYEHLQAAIEQTDADLAAGRPVPPETRSTLPAQRLALLAAKSRWRKATGQSENILLDILSDANGVNFHRFQMAVWTVVLSIIFFKEVYANLGMPIFNTTLMGLLGLSAGTYLGLKIPEPTVPKH